MSSISEIKYGYLLKSKPYITKKELSLVLEKKDRNLDKKILQLLKKKELISLKKGLYVDPVYLTLQRGKIEEYLANMLYYPSYLSLEYVLAKEGLIPEAVYSYTSITVKTTRTFTNQVGTFIYRHLKAELFNGYLSTNFTENYRIKMAGKAKALFDLLYLKPTGQSQRAISRMLFSDLRLNWDNFSKEDVSEFSEYVALSGSPKMILIGKALKKGLS